MEGAPQPVTATAGETFIRRQSKILPSLLFLTLFGMLISTLLYSERFTHIGSKLYKNIQTTRFLKESTFTTLLDVQTQDIEMPFYKVKKDKRCESVLDQATFKHRNDVDKMQDMCTLRQYSKEVAKVCFVEKDVKYIVFFGDSRVRYKYREFTMSYIKDNSSSCDEIPDPIPVGLPKESFFRDFSCNTTSIRVEFWWVQTLSKQLVKKFMKLAHAPDKRPDIIVGSVGPWYCFTGKESSGHQHKVIAILVTLS